MEFTLSFNFATYEEWQRQRIKYYDVASPPFLKNIQIKICLDEGNHSMVYHRVGEDRLYWTPYEQKHFDTHIESEKQKKISHKRIYWELRHILIFRIAQESTF
jgi:hypothetical protein